MSCPLAKMCRNGARENCPVQRCRFQHTTPAHVIYSTTPKGAVPPPPTPVTSPAGTCFPSAEHGARGWRGDVNAHAQHVRPSVENAAPRDMNGSATAPSGALDADALAQGRAIFSLRVSRKRLISLSQRQMDSRYIARGSRTKSRCKRPRYRL
jgi:hypothetical protein